MTNRLLAIPIFVLMHFTLLAAEKPIDRSNTDQLKIAAQGICPVSGEPLGSMGKPPKIKVVDQELFLCCKGCANGEIKKEHWVAIHANFAKAQGICPIMENRLPKKPTWTIVDGQLIYVCCPPCIKKIQANPQESLAKVAESYRKSLEKEEDDE